MLMVEDEFFFAKNLKDVKCRRFVDKCRSALQDAFSNDLIRRVCRS